MGLTRGRNWQNLQTAALPAIGLAADASTEAILVAADKHISAPLRISATQPAADSKLNIAANRIQAGDGSYKSTPVIDDALDSYPATTVDFQTGVVTSGTVKTAGAAFALPTSTTGKFRRMAMVYVSADNWVDTFFSDEADDVPSLPSPEVLFGNLDGLPMGYLDLVATDTQAFKTAGSTTNIIENAGINRFDTGAGVGGGADTSFNLGSLTGTVLKIKKGKLKLSDGNVLFSGTAADDKPANLEIDLDSVLATPVASTVYWLYVDLVSLGNPVTLSDTGQKVIQVSQASQLRATTKSPSEVNQARYVPLGTVKTSGAEWAGATVKSYAGKSHDLVHGYYPTHEEAVEIITSAGASNVLTHGLSDTPGIITIDFWDDSAATMTTLDAASHVVDKNSTTVTVSTAGLTFDTNDYVKVSMVYLPRMSAAMVSESLVFNSGWLSADPGASLAHGLVDAGDIVGVTVLEKDTATGRIKALTLSTPVLNWDDANIYLDFTGFTFTGKNYRIITSPTALPHAKMMARGNKREFTNTGVLTPTTTAFPVDIFSEEDIVSIHGTQKVDGVWQPVNLVGLAWVEYVSGAWYLRGNIDSLVPASDEPVRIIVDGNSPVINAYGPASESESGVMTTGTQTIAGNKTFTGSVNFAAAGNIYQVKDANFDALPGRRYLVDTSLGAVTATLPAAPSQGDEVWFYDAAGTFDINNLTIGRNGNKIQGTTTDGIMSASGMMAHLIYFDATGGWRVFNG